MSSWNGPTARAKRSAGFRYRPSLPLTRDLRLWRTGHVASAYSGPAPLAHRPRRFRLLGTCAFRRTGSRLAQRGSTHVASASSGPAPFGAPARGSPKGARPRAWSIARSRSRGARLHTSLPFDRDLASPPTSGSPKGARPLAWSLTHSRSRGARLLPSGRLRAPRPGRFSRRRDRETLGLPWSGPGA